MKTQDHDARAYVQPLIDAALEAADPATAVRRQLRRDNRQLLAGHYRYDLDQGRVFLVAAGKAALNMATAALEVLGEDIWAGVVITKQIAEGKARRYVANAGKRRNNLAVFEAGHPISDINGIRATATALDLLGETESGDLLLCLLSGGASALFTQPTLPLPEWQQLVQALLESGCTINELNCVRKQLDRVKGGGLAVQAGPASTISLILSDVVGNPLDIIGSGPTAPNAESPGDALTVLHRYGVMKRVTPETWAVITEELTDPRHATSVSRFEELEVKNVIVGDVRSAAMAAVTAARNAGYRAELLTAYLQGEAREVGLVAAALAKEL
ncbi:MAG TPA: glycerate-2-kinase family protein, partial [Candidatus Binatia bacterium]|nr:glycerate-2-kinase family protein [Candidatus Binatia bacterium]